MKDFKLTVDVYGRLHNGRGANIMQCGKLAEAIRDTDLVDDAEKIANLVEVSKFQSRVATTSFVLDCVMAAGSAVCLIGYAIQNRRMKIESEKAFCKRKIEEATKHCDELIKKLDEAK